jgi:hypothetical protein
MLGIIIDDIVHPLPGTIDAHKQSVVRLYSKNNVLTADNDAVVAFVTDNIFDVDLSACADKSTLTVSNGEESGSITIYNEVVDVEHLVKWLQMQQLGFMVPIMQKVGWHKLKEAALKAKELMDMQGTEGALQQLLTLLEADENVKLWRYWFRQTDDGEVIAYDNMTATDLADIGYRLTGELKLTYQQDSLNPWSEQIYDNVMHIVFTLNDIATCIKGILPATLQIKDYELIRMGLGMIHMQLTTKRNEFQTSLAEVGMGLSTPDILQYSFEPFVYDLDTKELIRLAPYYEQNAHGDAMCVMEITPAATIYDVKVSIDNTLYVTVDELTDTKRYCIKPPVGKHTLSYSYYTETGNLVQKSKQIQVLAAETRSDIYEFASPTDASLYGNTVTFIGLQSLISSWMQVSRWCHGNFFAPKSYQMYYIPFTASKVSVNDGTVTKVYDNFALDTVVEHMTNSIEQAIIGDAVSPQKYIVLTTIKPAGKFDFTVKYFDTAWHEANQLSKYYTDAFKPCWSVNTIQGLANIVNTSTAIVKVNGDAANDGHFMPINSLDEDFAKRMQKLHTVVCDMDVDRNVLMVRAFLETAVLSMTFGKEKSTELLATSRHASFGLNIVKCPQVGMPYIAYKQDMLIDLYADDVLIMRGYTYLVFALAAGKNYRLHIHNDWFDKQIQLQ